ncbi:hypothetical protein ACFVJ5_01495 [Nocardia sp. NPDC127606]|uniref:hypothetical protein n=1 Tax=Nocardia sp. NPDC127606 TaxID=3345406 RepID=UPI00363B1DD0
MSREEVTPMTSPEFRSSRAPVGLVIVQILLGIVVGGLLYWLCTVAILSIEIAVSMELPLGTDVWLVPVLISLGVGLAFWMKVPKFRIVWIALGAGILIAAALSSSLLLSGSVYGPA